MDDDVAQVALETVGRHLCHMCRDEEGTRVEEFGRTMEGGGEGQGCPTRQDHRESIESNVKSNRSNRFAITIYKWWYIRAHTGYTG